MEPLTDRKRDVNEKIEEAMPAGGRSHDGSCLRGPHGSSTFGLQALSLIET